MSTVIEMKGDRQEFREEIETTDMALFVRTSDESMHDWNRQRIVDALIRETYVDLDTANEIAREVEDLIATSKIKMITAPLIRELVDTKLIERGLEQARKMHTRLGMPLYDVDTGPRPPILP
jgi:ribonucleoside-triphosphate reductase